MLEKDSDIWMQNNPCIEILERTLKIVEIEERKVRSNQEQLDISLEE